MSNPQEMSADRMDARRALELGRMAARQADQEVRGTRGPSTGRMKPDRIVDMSVDELLPQLDDHEFRSLTIKELVHRVVPATPVVSRRLGGDDDEVLMVEQLVSLAGEPLFHAVGYSPIDTAQTVSDVIRGLDRHPRHLDVAELFLRFFGVPLGRVTIDVGAMRADLRTTRLLRLGNQNATLVREFWQYDVDGRARSYNFTQFRPDRLRLVEFGDPRRRAGAA